MYDTDGSGEINSSEIYNVLKALGLQSGAKDVNEIMNELDRNHDGRIIFAGSSHGLPFFDNLKFHKEFSRICKSSWQSVLLAKVSKRNHANVQGM